MNINQSFGIPTDLIFLYFYLRFKIHLLIAFFSKYNFRNIYQNSYVSRIWCLGFRNIFIFVKKNNIAAMVFISAKTPSLCLCICICFSTNTLLCYWVQNINSIHFWLIIPRKTAKQYCSGFVGDLNISTKNGYFVHQSCKIREMSHCQ